MRLPSIQNIKKHILYNGLSKRLYRESNYILVRENNSTMNGLSFITVVAGALLSLLSVSGLLSRNVLPAYLFLFLSSLVFILFRKIFKEAKKVVTQTICFMQAACLLIYGILNSAIFSANPETGGTIFVALLLVTPFLMIDLPYRMDVLLIVSTVAYCILLRFFKVPSLHMIDTVNAVSILIAALMCNWIFAYKRMQSIADRLYIEKARNTDDLTGLLRRGTARTITESYLNYPSHSGYFVVLDIDEFKKINDTQGHLYGDEVIKKVASILKKNQRPRDIISRFGGDEFTMFLARNDQDSALETMDAIFADIAEEFSNAQCSITCSAGITKAGSGDSYDDYFAYADEALYRSKNEGKNRYTIFTA
ncbi:MAG: GGDEF domain-containing protein [Lachnospiraceae bacterium]|nr:GGDEF domain-containing protein [Lachnospiraceae bacterium]